MRHLLWKIKMISKEIKWPKVLGNLFIFGMLIFGRVLLFKADWKVAVGITIILVVVISNLSGLQKK